MFWSHILVIVHQWCRKMFQYGWAPQACVLWFAGVHARNHTLSCAKKLWGGGGGDSSPQSPRPPTSYACT